MGKPTPALKRAVKREVGRGLMITASDILGPGFRRQYKLVQAKYLKHSGGAANATSVDGIPGSESLNWLGKRQDFDVTGD